MSADPAGGPQRGVHWPPGLERPGARRGLASVVAVGGTGRLRRLARAFAAPPLVPPDPYGYVAGLEAGTASLQRDGTP
jgi:hypothetical protein